MTARLPLFRQETPYSCMAACLRMVLAYLGTEVDEDTVREQSYTTLWGTSTRDAAACAHGYGLEAVWVQEAGPDDLVRWLEADLFPILVARLVHLGQWSKHAVVVEALSDDQLTYLDPADGQRHSMDRTVLEKAWYVAGGEAVFDCAYRKGDRSMSLPRVMREPVQHFPTKRDAWQQEQLQRLEPSRTAFQRLLPELLESHKNQFVAIYQERLVDTDPDRATLVQRTRAQGYRPVYIQKVTQQPRVVELPSPEEVRRVSL